MIKSFLTTACIFILSTPSHAVLIEHENYLTDTSTGLEWLKLTETTNKSFDEVSALTEVGQELAGWRYAFSYEFDQLLVNLGFTPSPCTHVSYQFCSPDIESNRALANDFINTFGDTYENYLTGTQTDAFTGYAYGFLGDPWSGGKSPLGIVSVVYNASTDLHIRTIETAFDSSRSSELFGSFLVRTHSVPEPSTLVLFSSFLTGLCLYTRRRNSASVAKF